MMAISADVLRPWPTWAVLGVRFGDTVWCSSYSRVPTELGVVDCNLHQSPGFGVKLV